MDLVIVGQKAVAEIFEVTERTVRNWIKAGLPRLSKRRFDRHQVQSWLDRRDGQVVSPRQPDGHDPLQPFLPVERGKDFEDSRMKRARADLLELDLKVRRGELVPRAQVQQMFVNRIMAVKQGLLSLPRALPPQLMVCHTEREMEPVIYKAVRDLLDAFARDLPESLVQSGMGPAQGGG